MMLVWPVGKLNDVPIMVAEGGIFLVYSYILYIGHTEYLIKNKIINK